MILKHTFLSVALALSTSTTFAATTDWMTGAIDQQFSEAVALRRDIHQHAELGNQETRTQKVVADYLRKQGIEVVTGWKNAPTAVIGIINPQKTHTVALRSELDALPIQENTGLPFASKMTGEIFGKQVSVSHMCGHDVHMAMLLSAARILQQNRDKFDNRVVLIFQPAEEGDTLHDLYGKDVPPAGGEALVKDGLIEKYDIRHVFALHVMAREPAGKVLVVKGPTLNSADGFHIQVEGQQSHGAMPWAGTDATLTAANIVVGLQQIVSRNANLSEGMGVITVGKLSAGEADNVMSGKAELSGTIRSNNPDIRETLIRRIPQVAEGIASAAGAKATTQIAKIYPVTVNDPALVDQMLPLLKNHGVAAELSTWNPGASEDFSFYAQKVPSAMMFLGADSRNAKQAANNHSDKFVVDEETMRSGIRAHLLMATHAW